MGMPHWIWSARTFSTCTAVVARRSLWRCNDTHLEHDRDRNSVACGDGRPEHPDLSNFLRDLRRVVGQPERRISRVKRRATPTTESDLGGGRLRHPPAPERRVCAVSRYHVRCGWATWNCMFWAACATALR